MNEAYEKPNSLAAAIVSFCRFARSNGMQVGMQQTISALEATALIGSDDQNGFRLALRTTLCTSHEEWEKFDRLFAEFWTYAGEQSSTVVRRGPRKTTTIDPSAQSRLLVGLESDKSALGDNNGKLVAGASTEQKLKRMDFAEASCSDLAALERLSNRLLRRMSLRLSRKLHNQPKGNHVDLRRSIRRNISRGGEPVDLAYKARKPQRMRLVIFLDISGSMNLYSLFLLRFAFALQKHFKRVDTFLFSTGVVKVSDVLRARKLSDALQGLSLRAPEWSGGTRIGGSLREFGRQAARRTLSSNTCFIILSDGWDTGAPEILATELRIIRARVKKLLWLNPLLGLKDYQPVTRGMRAALPHVDVFAPAHNLESLLKLERYL